MCSKLDELEARESMGWCDSLPALDDADVGIASGPSRRERAARESSDMSIHDDLSCVHLDSRLFRASGGLVSLSN